MVSKSSVMWSIKELVEALKLRQLNEFDVNMGVSGKRGDGKSTLINKLLLRFKGFKQLKHQVYKREDIINLLKNQEFKYCWDDEAINSGYKRDFQNKGQKELIKTLTAYRDNFNIYATAIPFFYSLDKDLRELIFLHIHIIERGLAVLFMPLEDNMHQTDPWDTKNNAKKEEKWQKKKAENPDFRFPWHKLSTFAGYITFGDLTLKQKERYKEIKKLKRGGAFLTDGKENNGGESSFYDRVYDLLIQKKLTRDGLIQMCLVEGKKYSAVATEMNKRLTDSGITETLRKFFKTDPNAKDRIKCIECKKLFTPEHMNQKTCGDRCKKKRRRRKMKEYSQARVLKEKQEREKSLRDSNQVQTANELNEEGGIIKPVIINKSQI